MKFPNSRPRPKWSPLEHHLWRLFRKHAGLKETKLVLFVSGGLDSMTLAQSFWNLQSPLNLMLQVVHCHHGDHEDQQMHEFRNQAARHVEVWCEQKSVSFSLHRRDQSTGESEAELRSFRRGHALEWVKSGSVVVTAHHAADLLETRLIRLIRGTGRKGLRAMSEFDGQIFRPFLNLAKAEIVFAARSLCVPWLDDPSNLSLRPLRNWLRHDWLLSLEQKRPGSTLSLARSLDLLSEKQVLSPSIFKILPAALEIDRSRFRVFARAERLATLTRALEELGLREHSRAQMLEVERRLDSPRKSLTFSVAGAIFRVHPDKIQVCLPP